MGIDSKDIARMGPAAQKQILRKWNDLQSGKSKYNNQKDSRGAVKFDSRKEARRYDELMLMLQSGKIRNLKLQPQFTLQESYKTPEGKRVNAIRYVADFSYEEKFMFDAVYCGDYENAEKSTAWQTVVEDVKSAATKTRAYHMKRKMMLEKFGIEIREIE